MKCTFLLFEISDLSDNDLKMTYLCSNYEWWKLYWKMSIFVFVHNFCFIAMCKVIY